MSTSTASPPAPAGSCPIAATFDVVGPRSAFLVLREASFGTRRFADFVARSGLSEPITAGRLRQLVAEGLLERHTYREPGQRARDEYTLTAKGRAIVPVLIALREWGERYALEPGEPVGRLEHVDCGAGVRTGLHCDAGHAVEVTDASFVRGPA
ncbi:winged helix-turn-helix transcriptional regulator [Nakamurella deserti]|uniref:winged helix-turn-helix transcriptional regulator n=1 Tax=Nakamurella deserti TaxID=2164074 RepID=UPI000DBE806B|nr:helix-turn-helix domain-containing protein [Nakamurella deserti]